MARKTAMVPIEDEGRDKGKLFLITEMPSAQGEEWAMRALLALMDSGVDIPDGAAELGMASLAEVGLKAIGKLKWEIAQPLLTEMFCCVALIPDKTRTHVARPVVDDDIEEISTRLKLRMEVFKLHTDFLQAAVPSIFPAGAKAAQGNRRATRTSPRS